MVVVPETHSDVFDGTKLIVQTLNSIGLGRGEGKEWEGQYNLALLQFDGQIHQKTVSKCPLRSFGATLAKIHVIVDKSR